MTFVLTRMPSAYLVSVCVKSHITMMMENVVCNYGSYILCKLEFNNFISQNKLFNKIGLTVNGIVNFD